MTDWVKKQKNSKSSRIKGQGKDELCKECNEKVEVNSKGILCEICEKWFHSGCVDIDDSEYEVLTKHDKGQIHWYCPGCNDKTSEILKILNGLQERTCKTEIELEKIKKEVGSVKKEIGIVTKKLEKEIKKLEEEISTIKKDREVKEVVLEISEIKKTTRELENKLESVLEAKMVKSIEKKVEERSLSFRDIVKLELENELKKNVNETVKKEIECKMGDVSSDIKGVQKIIIETKQQVDEEREREKRRNNIILYRVPESSASKREDRYKEDTEFCNKLISEILEVECEEGEIRRVLRLGEKKENFTRPILIELSNKVIKNLIMESLSKLKNADIRYKNIIFAHDLTKVERERCKELVVEAKKREEENESGEFIFRVRGIPSDLKIIKLKKR